MRRWLPLLVATLALLLSAQGLTLGFGESDQGWSGGFYGQAVRALSFADLGAMRPEGTLYLDHPPGVVWLSALSSALLGHGPLAMRLIPWLCGGLAAAGVVLLVEGELPGPWAALAGLASVAHPLVAYYASLPDPQGSLVWVGIVWACVAAQRSALPLMVGALVWTCLMDWPGLLLGGALTLWHLSHGQRSRALLCAGVSAVMGVGLGLWIGALGGWPPLWRALLHRSGARGFLDEASEPMGALASLQAIASHHLWGASWPLTAMGLVGLVWALRRRSILALPAGVGLLHVLLFVQGAAIHRYWQLYAVSGLSLVGVAWLGSLRAPKWAPVLALGLLCLMSARGVTRAHVLWLQEAPSRAMLSQTGARLAQSTPPRQPVHSPEGRVPALAWHADRVIDWESAERRQVWRSGQGWVVRSYPEDLGE